MIPVYLNPSDQGWALDIAHQRWKYVEEHHLQARFGDADEEKHQQGAMAELAFCRALGLEWPHTVNTFTEVPDVNPNWEVRFLSAGPKWRGVKVLEKDDDDRLVAWVTGKIPRFEVMGYFRAGGAKGHPEWWLPKKVAPLWLVPESRMIPINPGFHDICPMGKDDWDMFFCVVCGRRSTYAPA